MKIKSADSSDLLKRLNEIDEELQDFHISAHKCDLLYKEQDAIKTILHPKRHIITAHPTHAITTGIPQTGKSRNIGTNIKDYHERSDTMSDEIKIELIKDDNTENCIRISCRNLIVVDNSLHAAIEKFDTKLERRLRLGWDQAERIEKSMQQVYEKNSQNKEFDKFLQENHDRINAMVPQNPSIAKDDERSLIVTDDMKRRRT